MATQDDEIARHLREALASGELARAQGFGQPAPEDAGWQATPEGCASTAASEVDALSDAPPSALPVTLREISAESVIAITRLAVADSQKGFVASNAVSLAQALFEPMAWYRAIYAGDEPAGFVMLYDESLAPVPPAEPSIGVWRFMVDARFQGRGIGKAALQQVIAHVRSKQRFRTIELSYVPEPGCAEGFYLGLGFRHTGRFDDNEVVLELPLA